MMVHQNNSINLKSEIEKTDIKIDMMFYKSHGMTENERETIKRN
jgi:hypothetical protein